MENPNLYIPSLLTNTTFKLNDDMKYCSPKSIALLYRVQPLHLISITVCENMCAHVK